MADIITWAETDAALLTLIQSWQSAYSNLSLQEVLDIFNQVRMTGADADQMLSVANILKGVGEDAATVYGSGTATEAFAAYEAAQGSTSAVGAAVASTGAETVTANLAVVEGTSQGTFGAMGLLTLPLPTAFAAIAPLVGVAAGASLYESNPELWTKISETLLPWAYEDSNCIPALMDSDGNTYIGENVINAVREALKDYGVITDSGDYIDVPTYTYNGESLVTAGNYTADGWSGYYLSKRTTWQFSYCTWTDSPYLYSWYMGGGIYGLYNADSVTHRFYFGRGNTPGSNLVGGTDVQPGQYMTYNASYMNSTDNTSVICSINPADAPDIIGNGRYSEGQEGLEKWSGNTPSTTPTVNVLNGDDGHGLPKWSPYVKTGIPTDSGKSYDPAENPNPNINPDPNTILRLFGTPTPSPSQTPDGAADPEPPPLPDPVPELQTVPDPDADPSQSGDPDSDNPTPPDTPTDSGTADSPSLPVIPPQSAGSGLIHVYNPDYATIQSFGSWLWSTWSSDIIDSLAKIFNNPMDGVISLHELYATPSVSGSDTIRCGYLDSRISAPLVDTRYTDINCGTIVVQEYYANYLDYSPYTQVYVYLPFVGIMPLSADDVIGNAVSIVYHVDSYTGSCVAVLTCAKNGYSAQTYQFQGNCAVSVPLTSGYQSTLLSGLLALAGTAAGMPVMGAVGAVANSKNVVQHSGNFGSTYGAMGVKKPYLIIKRPIQKRIYNYSELYGYPAHADVIIGRCRGYLRAIEVVAQSTNATNEEKEEIISLLKEGVYV